MKYKDFEVWQFVGDEYFCDWVLNDSEHSNEFWGAFISEHPEKAQEIKEARDIVWGIQYAQTPEMDDKTYTELFEKILESKDEFQVNKTENERYLTLPMIWRYAAVVLLCMGTVLIWYKSNKPTEEFQHKVVPQLVTVESPLGSQITTMLSDGTKVKLNAGSTLSYYKPFLNDSLRVVNLVGEAFFDVERDTLRPFIVNTAYMQTAVLGTEFNISSYPEDKEVSVSVKEGKVRVTNDTEASSDFTYTLTRYQQSVYDVNSGNSAKKQLSDGSIFSWTQWELVFKKERLEDILKRTERWYGVSFEIGARVNLKETYSGKFQNQSLKSVLEAFRAQGAFRYSFQKDNPKIITIN